MANPSSDFLKLHIEPTPNEIWPKFDRSPSFNRVIQQFEAATGWPLHYVPGNGEVSRQTVLWSAELKLPAGDLAGRLCIVAPTDDGSADRPPLELAAATKFAESLVCVLTELVESQTALWQREAELAAGVPVAVQEDEEYHLAWRLEAVLKGGAEAIGAQAAGLYLLDAATTQLKLRSCWGLPFARFSDPTRPLAEAMADLEALLGHVVVLDGSEQIREWNPPEEFSASVCVPVSTPAVPLGTLWMFAEESRGFSEADTNIIEIIAGRLAADLEREMLLAEGIEGSRLKKQQAAVDRVQQSQIPHVAPLIDDWELAGWLNAPEGGGDFYDWFLTDEGLLAVIIGNAFEPGPAGAVISSGLRGAARSHGEYASDAVTLLDRINRTTWTGSCGDHRASLACTILDTDTGRFTFACAGQPGAIQLGAEGHRSLDGPAVPLGVDPKADFVNQEGVLGPGDALILFSEGIREARDIEGRPLSADRFADALLPSLDDGAEELAQFARNQIDDFGQESAKSLRSLLVVKHARA